MKTQQQIALDRAEIMTAFANGSEIEYKIKWEKDYRDNYAPQWNWDDYDYRVKVIHPVFWEAEDGKIGWRITVSGNIVSSTSWSKEEIALGSVYETALLAIQARDIRFATQRLKKAISEINKGISYPFVSGKCNYANGLCDDELSYNSWANYKHNPNWMYLSDEQACKELIASHSDDLKLVLGQ